MGLIDDIVAVFVGTFRAIIDTIDTATDAADEFLELVLNPDQIGSVIGENLEELQPFDEAAGVIVEAGEEFVLSDIREEGQLTPDNVDNVLDQAEGGAAGLAVGLLGTVEALEASTAFQMEVNEELLAQAAGIFGFSNLVGREIDARLQEGIDPALKQQVHKDHRSKQADFQDFTEANLRSKPFGGDIPTRSGEIPPNMRELFADEDFGWLADPDTYGTVPDQTELFELVGLASREPEELFEELPQKGVVPSRASVEQILDTAGLPEDVKEGFYELWRNTGKNQDLIEESIRLEEPLRVIDEAVFDGRLPPQQAVALIEDDINDYVTVPDSSGTPQRLADENADVQATILEELRRRFDLLASIPNTAPSRGQIERFFRNGVISGEQFAALNDRYGILPEFFSEMVIDNVIRKGPDDIQEQFILGRLSASEAQFQLGLIGFTQQETAQILSGADPDDVIEAKFEATREQDQQPVSVAVNIGEARSQQLRAIGIETLSDLAAASVEQVTEITDMSDQQSAEAIESAQTIIAQGG